MLQQSMNFIESTGAASISALWIPMAFWIVAGIIIMGLLRFADRSDVLFQYHVRAAVILSLPAGMTGIQLIKWTETLFAESVNFVYAMRVVEIPFTVTGQAGGEPASIEWMPFLLGVLVLFLASVSGIKLFRLVIEAYLLSAFRKNSNGSSSSVLPNLDGLNRKLLSTIRFRPQFIVSSRSALPLTHGGFRPLVIIPKELMASPKKMNMAVRHELMHIKRGDYLLNVLMKLTQALFWFNPLIYYLLDQLMIYRELSCDRDVLNESHISGKEYAELLVELSTRRKRVPETALSMSVNPSNLKRRILFMKKATNKKETYKKSFVLSTATLLVIALVMSVCGVQQSMAGDSPPDSALLSVSPGTSGEGPELIGGLKTLQTRIRYPEEARREGIEGRVDVQFTISREGEVVDPQVVNGIGGGCDREALRAVRAASFKTGNRHDADARYRYTFVFKLMGSGNEAGTAGEQESGSGGAEELGRLVVVGYGPSPNNEKGKEKEQSDDSGEGSLQSLIEAVEANPGNDGSLYKLGVVYQNRASDFFNKRNRTGNEEEARALDKKARDELRKAMSFYEKAAEINPGNTDYWQSLYRVYVALGMSNKAVQAKEKAGIE